MQLRLTMPILVTEPVGNETDEWVTTLVEISRSSGHELRNALNALVVNLEVVRSFSKDASIKHFVDQSVTQSEEAVRLAESAIALLNLIVESIGPDGAVRCSRVHGDSIRIEASSGEAERAARSLGALADRAGMSVDVHGSAVILKPIHSST